RGPHRRRSRVRARVRRGVRMWLGTHGPSPRAGTARESPARPRPFIRRPRMKLVRYGRAGAEKPGLIDTDGKLRDLSRVVKDITPAVLSPAGLKKLRETKLARLPVVSGRPRFGSPLVGIGKMVCIGLNYTD